MGALGSNGNFERPKLDIRLVNQHHGQLVPEHKPVCAVCQRLITTRRGRKGFGFVNYLDPSACSMAMETINGMKFPDGSWLTVRIKQNRSDNQDQRGGL